MKKLEIVKPLPLGTLYYAMSGSHLRYGCQVWDQTENCAVKNLETLHNKPLDIINFKGPCNEANNLYKDLKIMQLNDVIMLLQLPICI